MQQLKVEKLLHIMEGKECAYCTCGYPQGLDHQRVSVPPAGNDSILLA